MERSFNVYDRLVTLPLFQGMGSEELDKVLTHTKFGFHKHTDEEVIVAEGDPCDTLRILIRGNVACSTASIDHGYVFVEKIGSPYIMQPERLFGLSQRYSRTFTASGEVSLMTLEKTEVTRLIEKSMVFRINFLNILSTLTQRAARHQWQNLPADLRQRMVRFFEAHCLIPAGEKTIKIKMTRLADELNVKRLSVSKELHMMSDEKMLNLHRGRIIIPALEKLIME